jgi:hypothetical protein
VLDNAPLLVVRLVAHDLQGPGGDEILAYLIDTGVKTRADLIQKRLCGTMLPRKRI